MNRFLRKYNIKLIVKNKSNFMRAAGLIQALFSKISYKEFMNGYTSTIGNTIYGSSDWIERLNSGTFTADDVALLVHETQHVLQFRNGTWKKYVRSGGRALLEAEAISYANMFRIAVESDGLKTRDMIVDQLTRYGCKLKDCHAAATYVEIAQTKPLSDCEMVYDAVTEFSK